MNNLLSLKFWFSIRPGALSPMGIKFFIVSIIVLIIVSLFLKLITVKSKEKLHRRLYRKLANFTMTNIFFLMFIFFLMYEAVPFLSSRFWFLVLLLIDLVWLYYIWKFYRTIPSRKEEIKKNTEYNKYIP